MVTRMRLRLEALGEFTRFVLSTLGWLFHGRSKWLRASLLRPQLYEVGFASLPVICITGLFIGMVLAVEAYVQFAAIGQEAALGGIINVSVVKQIGPVLAAVMLAGRVGGAVSAQLGTMRVTEQLDALRAMGADPVAHLVVPRFIACLLMVPAVSMFSNLMGILGGYLVTVKGFGVNAGQYWDYSAQFIQSLEVFVGVGKSFVFGAAIGLISCYKGFHCEAGAQGVGKAATDAFVASFIVIITSNFFLAKFFNDVHAAIIWPVAR